MKVKFNRNKVQKGIIFFRTSFYLKNELKASRIFFCKIMALKNAILHCEINKRHKSSIMKINDGYVMCIDILKHGDYKPLPKNRKNRRYSKKIIHF